MIHTEAALEPCLLHHMEGQDGKSPRAHHEPALALARASSARERDMRKELEQWRQRGKRGKENVSSNSLDETKHRLSWESESRPLSPRPELRVSATRAAAAVGLLQKPTLCAPPSSPVSSGAVLGPRNGAAPSESRTRNGQTTLPPCLRFVGMEL